MTVTIGGASQAEQQAVGGTDWTYARIQEVCRRVGDPEIPAADRPTPAQARALKGCDSEKLYYGEGVPADYLKARHCAITEADKADDTVFAGASMLMQICANGHGVKRNLDLATSYACTIDTTPAEYESRIAHLQRMRKEPDNFDYCDDVTSGEHMGLCSDRFSRASAISRDSTLRSLAAGLPPASAPLYAAMKKAFDAFVDAHAGEIDQSGTARIMNVNVEEDAVLDQFVRDLRRLEAGTWPTLSGADVRTADMQLNVRYREALARVGVGDNYSTIKPEDIRGAQRTWLIYRDAYLRFAATSAPAVAHDAVLARLTRLRLAQLDQVAAP